MINTTLENYRPFEYTAIPFKAAAKQLHFLSHKNLKELAIKITTLALTIISFIPALGADLILTTASITYKCIRTKQSFAEKAEKENSPEIKNLINKVLETPNSYTNSIYSVNFNDNDKDKQFFKNSLTEAYEFLNEQQKAMVTDLIKNYGVLEEGEPKIDIWVWMAQCLIAFYLRVDRADRIYTSFYIPTELYNEFSGLSGDDRANILLNLMIPNSKITLTENAEKFNNRFVRIAYDITRDQNYNKYICQPIIRNLDWLNQAS